MTKLVQTNLALDLDARERLESLAKRYGWSLTKATRLGLETLEVALAICEAQAEHTAEHVGEREADLLRRIARELPPVLLGTREVRFGEPGDPPAVGVGAYAFGLDDQGRLVAAKETGQSTTSFRVEGGRLVIQGVFARDDVDVREAD